jgi:hypothetical protein
MKQGANQSPHQSKTAIELAQRQGSGIRADHSAIEPGNHPTTGYLFKLEQPWHTLCRHRGIPSGSGDSMWQLKYLRF